MRTLAIATICSLALSTPVWAGENPQLSTMALTGTASIDVAPDMATVTTGVTSQAETAREALDANNAAMQALMDVLENANIAPKDIQTSGFSVQPQFVYSDNRDENGYTRPPEIAGYQVTNNVAILVHDLDKLGPVLDQVVTAGSNTISGISFGLEDSSDALNMARKQAVANALGKADLYAEAAGVELGRILSISENGGNAPQPLAMKAMRMEAAPASVPVQAGEISYAMSVSVQWELEQ